MLRPLLAACLAATAASPALADQLIDNVEGLRIDENGKIDDEVSIISSDQNRKIYEDRFKVGSKYLASDGWHAECVPHPKHS